MTAAVVLVHGGGFDSRCWDLVVPLLRLRSRRPVLAVDLPGRGRHPAPLSDVSLASCAESVAGDIDAAGYEEVVLVGHSLAGCSMPSIIDRLAGRVRHAVFVACTVPEDGRSAFDTLDPAVQAMIEDALRDPDPAPHVMSADIARMVLGDDLDERQVEWCVERLVPEAPRLTTDPVAVAPLARVPSTWIRTTRDLIVAPDTQLRFARNVGPGCRVIDIDAGHMCMVSRPDTVTDLLAGVASPPS